MCGFCREKFNLQSIVSHETLCREKLSETNAGDIEIGGSSLDGGDNGSSTKTEEFQKRKTAATRRLTELRMEISTHAKLSPQDIEEAWRLCLERLKAIVHNATLPRGTERKYRRLKKKNEAYYNAVGRWRNAEEFMKALGIIFSMMEFKTLLIHR